MKKLSLIPIFILLLVACSSPSKNSNPTTDDSSLNIEKRVDLYAFHGTRQCTTCKNMKAFTKATLDKYFKEELKSGTLTYQVIDVDEEQNYALAEKFEATGTALMINSIQKGTENIEDWSDFAFEFANGDHAIYEAKLKKMITEKLN